MAMELVHQELALASQARRRLSFLYVPTSSPLHLPTTLHHPTAFTLTRIPYPSHPSTFPSLIGIVCTYTYMLKMGKKDGGKREKEEGMG